MRTRKHLKCLLLMCLLVVFFATTASALEYDFDPPDDYLFGRSTSQDVIYEEEDVNVNRSKTCSAVYYPESTRHYTRLYCIFSFPLSSGKAWGNLTLAFVKGKFEKTGLSTLIRIDSPVV